MRSIFIAMVMAAGFALVGSSSSQSAPTTGTAVRDAVTVDSPVVDVRHSRRHRHCHHRRHSRHRCYRHHR